MDNQNNVYYNYAPSVAADPARSETAAKPAPPRRPAREYSKAESVFAWLSVLFGYLFCRVNPVAENPFGGLIFVALIFTVTLVVLKIMGKPLTVLSVAVALSAIIVSLTFLFTANEFLYFIAYSYCIAAYLYFIYAATGNTVKKGFNDYIVADFFKAMFVMPFASMGCMFKAMFSGKSRGKGKIMLKVLIGIGVAVIPTLMVFCLLSYDSDFMNLLGDIFDFNFENIFSHILSLTFGVGLGLYLYGLFISSLDKKCENALCEKNCKKVFSKMRIAPAITVVASVIPLMFLYIVFFISQWKYYVSAFTNVLPENFSYADYARKGFFELCIVSVINLFVIVNIVLLLKRNKKSSYVILRITAVAVSLATLVLISTAISKMFMYISRYGLTQKRVFATWFMVFIAFVFIFICIRLFVRSFKPIAVVFVVGLLMFSTLALPDADAFIAEYNVNAYLDGTLSNVDVDALEELEHSAIPSLVKLYREIDRSADTDAKRIYFRVEKVLLNYADEFNTEDKNIFAFTIVDAKAQNALKEIEFIG